MSKEIKKYSSDFKFKVVMKCLSGNFTVYQICSDHNVAESTIHKRLSSYAKQNSLYRTLKEFGRITKTLFILKYYDDVELRQKIEKQLNLVELSHKFAKAIFLVIINNL